MRESATRTTDGQGRPSAAGVDTCTTWPAILSGYVATVVQAFLPATGGRPRPAVVLEMEAAPDEQE